MSKVQEAGLIEALGEAEGLARVIRAMSDGRLDLEVVVRSQPGGKVVVQLSWEQARAEARLIAGLPVPGDGVLTRVQETFCSVCGPLDEPGVHSQQDCPRYGHTQPERPRDAVGRPPAQRLHEWTSDPRQPNVPNDRAATSPTDPRST